jgi:NH3-dependent NAD+ synthetase
VKLGILFSGGLDSTIIAYLADKFVPKEEPIDLLNVAFDQNESFDVPDRKTGLLSSEELRTLCPDRKWNFVEVMIVFVLNVRLTFCLINNLCQFSDKYFERRIRKRQKQLCMPPNLPVRNSTR